MVNLLLDRNADPNAKIGSGETPLHLACKCLADSVIKVSLTGGETSPHFEPQSSPDKPEPVKITRKPDSCLNLSFFDPIA